jgi:protein AroM
MAVTTGNKRAAFVTIGQTPRTDLVPEMASWMGGAIDVVEYGALDELNRREIDELAPTAADQRLVTRLRDGSEVIVKKEWMRDRLQELLTRLSREDFLVIVLLCTGHFEGLRVNHLFLEAQVMVPLAEQMRELHVRSRNDQTLRLSYTSPYAKGRLEEAAHDLADVDLIVMHCMGYTESMRRTVADISGRPTLLARRLVATAVAQLA